MREHRHYEGRDFGMDRRKFDWQAGKAGVIVKVDGKWWMPPKPFPTGFDQSCAEFDTVANAVYAVQEVFELKNFFDLDENDEIARVYSVEEFIRVLRNELGLP